MEKKRIFRICKVCGNLVGMIVDSGAVPVCCGREMTLLEANTTDAAVEKHVPVVTREKGIIHVQVGSVPHPMAEEHYITWITLSQDGRTQRQQLLPGDKPAATFHVDDTPCIVYAYCNLHGLWAYEE